MDRRVLSVVPLAEQDDADKRYWLGKSPHERLEAVEETRQMISMPGFHPCGKPQQLLFSERMSHPVQV